MSSDLSFDFYHSWRKRLNESHSSLKSDHRDQKSVKSMAVVNQLLPAFLFSLYLFISPQALACDSGDRAALLKIKASFLNPSNFSWNESASCCTWRGVYCAFNATRVNAISFYNNGGPGDGLVGRLPDALGDLPYLSTLLIANYPGVYGRLPSTLTRLRSLSILTLASNSLSGAIPSFLSQIPSLTLLDLSNNKFSGCIPPELSALPILQTLILQNNRLEGGIPSSFGNFNKSSPPNLFLANNKLSGDIPPEFGAPDWVNLDLSHNKLSGDASFLFGAKKPTNLINLSFNKLEFDMSRISFSVSTWTLAVNNNRIIGSIPAQINRLSNLVNFNVSYNRLCGIIPAGPVMDKFDDTHFYHNKCLCRSQYSCL